MEFDAVLLPPRRAESIARGLWRDRTINQDLDACVADCPDKLALTAIRIERGEVRRFTYRQLAALADRIAVGLSRLGVGRNDVVAICVRLVNSAGSHRAVVQLGRTLEWGSRGRGFKSRQPDQKIFILLLSNLHPFRKCSAPELLDCQTSENRRCLMLSRARIRRRRRIIHFAQSSQTLAS